MLSINGVFAGNSWINKIIHDTETTENNYLQLFPEQLRLRTNDSQSTHWETVGLHSWVPMLTVSRTQ